MNRAAPWIIALLVSILTNGVLIGFVLHKVSDGPTLRPPPHHQAQGRQPRGDRFNYRAFLEALPEGQRAAARERLEEERSRTRDLFEQVRDAQMEARDAILAEPYDADAVQSAFGALRTARMDMEASLEAVILDIVADLDAESRAAAIEAGRRPSSRPRDGRRRRPPPPRDRH